MSWNQTLMWRPLLMTVAMTMMVGCFALTTSDADDADQEEEATSQADDVSTQTDDGSTVDDSDTSDTSDDSQDESEEDIPGAVVPLSSCDTTPSMMLEPFPEALSVFALTMDKYASVFGVPIVATAATPEDKVLHAAAVMAAYLDNDGDGRADDRAVCEAMLERRAFLAMANNEQEGESFAFEAWVAAGFGAGQDLYASETDPEAWGPFDYSLEEVLHLISDYGYAAAYPSVFGTRAGTEIANAMDTSRGGYFAESDEDACQSDEQDATWETGQCALPPSGVYPAGAWYTYDDTTCDYSCMVTEYLYWVLTTILGAHDSTIRCSEIQGEWQLCEPEQVQSVDSAAYNLLTDPQYTLPTTLPTGTYIVADN